MTDWTGGYVADIGYTYGYYSELNPLRARLAFLNAGFAPPEAGTHCELGFGQGISVNIHAAASETEWWATDFNPSQAGFAQSLAKVSGAKAQLFDEAFAEFGSRADLPDFDSISLHGIWSWISDENRAVIVDFIRRKLKVGGALYISYNTQPGWAPMVPMRHLLTEHAATLGAEGVGILTRIDAALDFAGRLIESNPIYARANPTVAERLKQLVGQNRHYLAHEYFNRDWHPMHFADMARWLEPAKLGYACSAHYLDHIESLNLSAEQQALLKDIPDAQFRESVRDFCVNQQFRRDYWVKGGRRLAPLQQSEALRAQRVVLVLARQNVSLKVKGAMGEAMMQETVYCPILDLLADHKARTLAEIEQSCPDIPFAQIIQAVMVLSGNGILQGVQDEAAIAKAKPRTDRLNAHLCDLARSGVEISYLASPVTGGGIAVGRFQQLFLLALKQGKRSPQEWAAFVWPILAQQDQRVAKDGKPLITAEENLAELEAQAVTFAETRLPVLEALGIA